MGTQVVSPGIERKPDITKYLIVFAVMSSTIMEIVDTSVVNVSLPHIAGSLSASIDEATWVLTSYIVANAVMIPLTGWLSHFVGRKRLLLTVVTGFTISSMLCGLAPSLPLLVFFRVMQGITGGGLQPLSQSVLLETFPPQERGRAMAIWGLGVVFAPIIGPTLGGWITQTYSWRWVFFINLPIGITSLLLISAYIHDPHYIKRASSRIDGVGIALLVLGMGALQTVFDKGQQEDWFSSSLIVTLTIIAAVILPTFIIREIYSKDPLVKLRLFKGWNFCCGSIIAVVMYFVLYGSLVLIPLFMQTVLGWSALTTGLWTSPRGLGSLAGMILLFWVPWFKKVDGRKLVTAGFGATGLLFFMYARMNLNSGTWDIVVPQVVQGLALALAFVPLTTLTMSFVKLEDMPYATSLYSTIRNIGSSIGISFVATYLDRRNQIHHAILAENMVPGNPQVREFIGGLRHYFELRGSDAHLAGQQAVAILYKEMLRQANILSFLDAFRLLGTLFLIITPIALRMKRPPLTKPK